MKIKIIKTLENPPDIFIRYAKIGLIITIIISSILYLINPNQPFPFLKANINIQNLIIYPFFFFMLLENGKKDMIFNSCLLFSMMFMYETIWQFFYGFTHTQDFIRVAIEQGWGIDSFNITMLKFRLFLYDSCIAFIGIFPFIYRYVKPKHPKFTLLLFLSIIVYQFLWLYFYNYNVRIDDLKNFGYITSITTMWERSIKWVWILFICSLCGILNPLRINTNRKENQGLKLI